jgi:hypothetical protein
MVVENLWHLSGWYEESQRQVEPVRQPAQALGRYVGAVGIYSIIHKYPTIPDGTTCLNVNFSDKKLNI